MTALTLVRGLPGSGKSTLAQDLILTKARNDINSTPTIHMEADMYFINAEGEYIFNPELLKEAHTWCQKRTFMLLHHFKVDVVVSNTFVKLWEMEPYLFMTTQTDAELFIIEADGQFGNTHGVSEETIERMKNNWETIPDDWINETICEECGEPKSPDYECCVYCEVCGVHYSEDDPCLAH